MIKSMNNDILYKGKRPDLKCHHCHNIGNYSIERYWILELKLNFENEKRSQKGYERKAHVVAAAYFTSFLPSNVENFSTNLSTLLNDFVVYL